MCGIVGIAGFDDSKLVRDMAKLISHRGPDDDAYFFDRQISLGMRRLSIIDLKKGIYPLTNEDETIQLIFNGEIYNFLELRPELEAKGHKFRTNCDGEVMVHLYEEYGMDFIRHLNGMFAVALYDARLRKLVLVRDRMGVKPLYYYYDHERLVFASEIKSILLHEGCKKELNRQSLFHYLLYRFVPGPETLFKGIYNLQPGHYLVFDLTKRRERLTIKRYWGLFEKIEKGSEEYFIKKFEGLFEDSVKKRMLSDVPLGVFLSGGIDSSSIVAMMKRTTDAPIKTFSVGFANAEDDDLLHARKMANYFGAEHQEFFVQKDDVFRLPSIVWHLDQPLGDGIIIPMDLLSETAKKKVTVILTGEGGDEIFAGYVHEKAIKAGLYYKSILPKIVRNTIISPSVRLAPINLLDMFFQYPSPLGSKGKEKFVEFLKHVDSEHLRYFSLSWLFNKKDIDAALTEKFRQSVNFDSELLKEQREILEDKQDFSDPINRVLMAEIRSWLPDNILFKQDKILMAHSLEGRVPFLDYRLVEFSMTLPPELKIKGLNGKYLLKKAMARHVPELEKRKKGAFVIPVHEYFKEGFEHLIDEHLSRQQVEKRGIINYGYVEKLLHKKNRQELIYNRQLISLLVLELWMKTYIDGDGKKLIKV